MPRCFKHVNKAKVAGLGRHYSRRSLFGAANTDVTSERNEAPVSVDLHGLPTPRTQGLSKRVVGGMLIGEH